MNADFLLNPVVLHLARGFVFLAIVFFAHGLIRFRRRSRRGAFAGSFWRVIVVFLGVLAFTQFLPGWWTLDIAPPARFSTPPAESTAGSSIAASDGRSFLPHDPSALATRSNRAGWILTLVWVTGAGFVMLHWVAGRIRLAKLRGESKPADDPALISLLENTRRKLEARRRILLLEHPAIEVPLTWGIFSPVILMPASARRWRPEERRMALLHELGHIRAGDASYQLLTRILLALHWVNPLAWISCRRLAGEQEANADRKVLEAGVCPSRYADLLLRLAGNRQSIPAAAAISMSRPSSVPQRVESILAHDPARPRSRATSQLALAAFLAAATIVLGATSIAVNAADPSPSKTQEDSANNVNLYTKAIPVPPNLSGKAAEDIPDGATAWSVEHLVKIGVEYPPGATSIFNPSTSQLIMRNTLDQFKTLEAYLSKLPQGNPAAVASDARPKGGKPAANPVADKLKRIIVPKVDFDDAPLTQCIGFLVKQSRQLDTTEPDPEKRGVDIVIIDTTKSRPDLVPDPKITLRLSNVPLVEALRYVSQLAQREFRIEKSTVVIRPKPADDRKN